VAPEPPVSESPPQDATPKTVSAATLTTAIALFRLLMERPLLCPEVVLNLYATWRGCIASLRKFRDRQLEEVRRRDEDLCQRHVQTLHRNDFRIAGW
jgi:hypothetical protein